MRNEGYQEYLKSDHWKNLRKRKWSSLHRRGIIPHCGICGIKDVPLDVHHKEYKNLYDVDLSLLVLLCRTCHSTAHKLMRSGKVRWKKDNHWSKFTTLRNRVRVELKLQSKRRKKSKPKKINENSWHGVLKEQISEIKEEAVKTTSILDKVMLVEKINKLRPVLNLYKQ